jgi:hypothetical protein
VRIGIALVAALLTSACAGGASDPAPSAPAATPTQAAASPAPPTDASDPAPEPPASPGDGGDLTGEPIDFFFSDGDTLGVVGVAADDVLNVRSAPGVQASVVATLEPLADAVATGSARQLSQSIWAEVEAGGATGWANVAYLAYIGATDDVTADVVEQLGGSVSAGTMVQLGQAVAETRASTEPPSTITVVDGPAVGDLGEITADVVGLGDDSVLGARLHVFGQPVEDGEGFGLKSVEQTTLCIRGVSDGLCV